MQRNNQHSYTRQIVFTVIVLLLTAAVIIGAWKITKDESVPMEDPSQSYASAISAIDSADTVYYRITGTKSFTFEGNLISEEYTRNISIQRSDSGEPQIYIDEVISIRDYDIYINDIYKNQTEYLTVQGVNFCAPAACDDFLTQQIPPVLIDPSLYTEISGESTAEQSVIHFCNANGIESWVASEVSGISSAEGTAYLDSTGKLTKSEYRSEYTCNDTVFQHQVTAQILTEEPIMITDPDIASYKEITSIKAPVKLEKACGYLLSADHIISDYTDKITYQAFGDQRKQTIHLETDSADSWSALIKTSISASNSSKADVVATTFKTETFHNNIYSVALDDEEPVINAQIDLDTMKSHCEGLLISTIVFPQYIETTTHTDTEDQCYISFNATEEFAQVLMTEAGNSLYQSPVILDNMAENYETNTVTAYLTLDRITGYPVSSGFNFLGTYTTSGIPYTLSFQADQVYGAGGAN